MKKVVHGSVGMIFLSWIVACSLVLASKMSVYGAVQLFGVGLTLICGILWTADQMSVIVLPNGSRWKLWLTLVASVITWGVALLNEPAPLTLAPLGLQASLMEVDAASQRLAQPRKRRSSVEYEFQAPIGVAAIVSGFATDSSAKPDISYYFYLEHQGSSESEYFAENIKDRFPHRYTERDIRELQNEFPDLQGKASTGVVWAERTTSPAGPFRIRVIVIDNLTRRFAQQELSVRVKDP